MGFTTGFVGGITATYALLYLSLHLHRTNRTHQSLLLTQQRALLTSIYDPPPSFYTDHPAYEIRKAGITEELKDRWNRELSTVVRNLQETDWAAVRAGLETKLGNAWANLKETDVAREVETRFKEGVVGGGEAAKQAEEDIKDAIKGVGREKRLLEIN